MSIWTGVDPLADKAPGWTPYRYGFNNPVRMIDPDGRMETDGVDPPNDDSNPLLTAIARLYLEVRDYQEYKRRGGGLRGMIFGYDRKEGDERFQGYDNALNILEVGTAFSTMFRSSGRPSGRSFSAPRQSARKSLATSWMKYDNYTKYVDFDKPVYTKTLKAGDELIQYRVKGNEGTVGNFYAPKGTRPEQIGLDPSDVVGDPLNVTVKKNTEVLISTHKQGTPYYKDNNVILEGGGTQIFSKELKNNIEF